MSFPQYRNYKKTGIPWLQELPAHWEVKRIKHTTYLKGRVGWKGLTSDEYLDSGYAYLVTGTDFSQKFIDWRNCYCVNQGRYEDDPFIQLKNGDLLITKDGTIGKLALVSNLDRPACLNSGIFVIRPNGGYIAEYMYWLLQSVVFRVFCDLSSTGSTIQHLYQNVFENFSFPVPSILEQENIVAFLDRETTKIDSLISAQEKLVNLVAEKRQATVSHAVTRGLYPNAPMKDSGVAWMGSVPTHWEVVPAKRVSSVFVPQRNKPDLNDAGDGVHWATMEDIKQPRLASTNLWVSLPAMTEAGSRVLRSGAVIASCVGNFGVASVNDVEVVINQQLQAFMPKPEILADYLRHCVIVARPYFEQVGTAATLAYVNQEGFENLPVPLPPVKEQVEIVKFLDAELTRLNEIAAQAISGISLLKERRAALIAAAVTGQIDVRRKVDNNVEEAELAA